MIAVVERLGVTTSPGALGRSGGCPSSRRANLPSAFVREADRNHDNDVEPNGELRLTGPHLAIRLLSRWLQEALDEDDDALAQEIADLEALIAALEAKHGTIASVYAKRQPQQRFLRRPWWENPRGHWDGRITRPRQAPARRAPRVRHLGPAGRGAIRTKRASRSRRPAAPTRGSPDSESPADLAVLSAGGRR